jgi:hypothetical protein
MPGVQVPNGVLLAQPTTFRYYDESALAVCFGCCITQRPALKSTTRVVQQVALTYTSSKRGSALGTLRRMLPGDAALLD